MKSLKELQSMNEKYNVEGESPEAGTPKKGQSNETSNRSAFQTNKKGFIPDPENSLSEETPQQKTNRQGNNSETPEERANPYDFGVNAPEDRIRPDESSIWYDDSAIWNGYGAKYTQMNNWDKAKRSAATGVGNTINLFGDALLMGPLFFNEDPNWLAKSISNYINEIGTGIQDKNKVYSSIGDITIDDMVKAEFWATTGAQMVPDVAMGIVTGGVGSYIGKSILKRTAKGIVKSQMKGIIPKKILGKEVRDQVLSTVTRQGTRITNRSLAGRLSSEMAIEVGGMFGAGLSQGIFYGMANGGQAYKEALELGLSKEQAAVAARGVFLDEMKWVGANSLMWGAQFGKLDKTLLKKTRRRISKNVTEMPLIGELVTRSLKATKTPRYLGYQIGRKAITGLEEGLQEGYQDWIRYANIREANGQEYDGFWEYINRPSIKGSVIAGFAAGMGTDISAQAFNAVAEGIRRVRRGENLFKKSLDQENNSTFEKHLIRMNLRDAVMYSEDWDLYLKSVKDTMTEEEYTQMEELGERYREEYIKAIKMSDIDDGVSMAGADAMFDLMTQIITNEQVIEEMSTTGDEDFDNSIKEARNEKAEDGESNADFEKRMIDKYGEKAWSKVKGIKLAELDLEANKKAYKAIRDGKTIEQIKKEWKEGEGIYKDIFGNVDPYETLNEEEINELLEKVAESYLTEEEIAEYRIKKNGIDPALEAEYYDTVTKKGKFARAMQKGLQKVAGKGKKAAQKARNAAFAKSTESGRSQDVEKAIEATGRTSFKSESGILYKKVGDQWYKEGKTLLGKVTERKVSPEEVWAQIQELEGKNKKSKEQSEKDKKVKERLEKIKTKESDLKEGEQEIEGEKYKVSKKKEKVQKEDGSVVEEDIVSVEKETTNKKGETEWRNVETEEIVNKINNAKINDELDKMRFEDSDEINLAGVKTTKGMNEFYKAYVGDPNIQDALESASTEAQIEAIIEDFIEKAMEATGMTEAEVRPVADALGKTNFFVKLEENQGGQNISFQQSMSGISPERDRNEIKQAVAQAQQKSLKSNFGTVIDDYMRARLSIKDMIGDSMSTTMNWLLQNDAKNIMPGMGIIASNYLMNKYPQDVGGFAIGALAVVNPSTLLVTKAEDAKNLFEEMGHVVFASLMHTPEGQAIVKQFAKDKALYNKIKETYSDTELGFFRPKDGEHDIEGDIYSFESKTHSDGTIEVFMKVNDKSVGKFRFNPQTKEKEYFVKKGKNMFVQVDYDQTPEHMQNWFHEREFGKGEYDGYKKQFAEAGIEFEKMYEFVPLAIEHQEIILDEMFAKTWADERARNQSGILSTDQKKPGEDTRKYHRYMKRFARQADRRQDEFKAFHKAWKRAANEDNAFAKFSNEDIVNYVFKGLTTKGKDFQRPIYGQGGERQNRKPGFAKAAMENHSDSVRKNIQSQFAKINKEVLNGGKFELDKYVDQPNRQLNLFIDGPEIAEQFREDSNEGFEEAIAGQLRKEEGSNHTLSKLTQSIVSAYNRKRDKIEPAKTSQVRGYMRMLAIVADDAVMFASFMRENQSTFMKAMVDGLDARFGKEKTDFILSLYYQENKTSTFVQNPTTVVISKAGIRKEHGLNQQTNEIITNNTKKKARLFWRSKPASDRVAESMQLNRAIEVFLHGSENKTKAALDVIEAMGLFENVFHNGYADLEFIAEWMNVTYQNKTMPVAVALETLLNDILVKEYGRYMFSKDGKNEFAKIDAFAQSLMVPYRMLNGMDVHLNAENENTSSVKKKSAFTNKMDWLNGKLNEASKAENPNIEYRRIARQILGFAKSKRLNTRDTEIINGLSEYLKTIGPNVSYGNFMGMVLGDKNKRKNYHHMDADSFTLSKLALFFAEKDMDVQQVPVGVYSNSKTSYTIGVRKPSYKGEKAMKKALRRLVKEEGQTPSISIKFLREILAKNKKELMNIPEFKEFFAMKNEEQKKVLQEFEMRNILTSYMTDLILHNGAIKSKDLKRKKMFAQTYRPLGLKPVIVPFADRKTPESVARQIEDLGGLPKGYIKEILTADSLSFVTMKGAAQINEKGALDSPGGYIKPLMSGMPYHANFEQSPLQGASGMKNIIVVITDEMAESSVYLAKIKAMLENIEADTSLESVAIAAPNSAIKFGKELNANTVNLDAIDDTNTDSLNAGLAGIKKMYQYGGQLQGFDEDMFGIQLNLNTESETSVLPTQLIQAFTQNAKRGTERHKEAVGLQQMHADLLTLQSVTYGNTEKTKKLQGVGSNMKIMGENARNHPYVRQQISNVVANASGSMFNKLITPGTVALETSMMEYSEELKIPGIENGVVVNGEIVLDVKYKNQGFRKGETILVSRIPAHGLQTTMPLTIRNFVNTNGNGAIVNPGLSSIIGADKDGDKLFINRKFKKGEGPKGEQHNRFRKKYAEFFDATVQFLNRPDVLKDRMAPINYNAVVEEAFNGKSEVEKELEKNLGFGLSGSSELEQKRFQMNIPGNSIIGSAANHNRLGMLLRESEVVLNKPISINGKIVSRFQNGNNYGIYSAAYLQQMILNIALDSPNTGHAPILGITPTTIGAVSLLAGMGFKLGEIKTILRSEGGQAYIRASENVDNPFLSDNDRKKVAQKALKAVGKKKIKKRASFEINTNKIDDAQVIQLLDYLSNMNEQLSPILRLMSGHKKQPNHILGIDEIIQSVESSVNSNDPTLENFEVLLENPEVARYQKALESLRRDFLRNDVMNMPVVEKALLNIRDNTSKGTYFTQSKLFKDIMKEADAVMFNLNTENIFSPSEAKTFLEQSFEIVARIEEKMYNKNYTGPLKRMFKVNKGVLQINLDELHPSYTTIQDYIEYRNMLKNEFNSKDLMLLAKMDAVYNGSNGYMSYAPILPKEYIEAVNDLQNKALKNGNVLNLKDNNPDTFMDSLAIAIRDKLKTGSIKKYNPDTKTYKLNSEKSPLLELTALEKNETLFTKIYIDGPNGNKQQVILKSSPLNDMLMQDINNAGFERQEYLQTMLSSREFEIIHTTGEIMFHVSGYDRLVKNLEPYIAKERLKGKTTGIKTAPEEKMPNKAGKLSSVAVKQRKSLGRQMRIENEKFKKKMSFDQYAQVHKIEKASSNDRVAYAGYVKAYDQYAKKAKEFAKKAKSVSLNDLLDEYKKLANRPAEEVYVYSSEITTEIANRMLYIQNQKTGNKSKNQDISGFQMWMDRAGIPSTSPIAQFVANKMYTSVNARDQAIGESVEKINEITKALIKERTKDMGVVQSKAMQLQEPKKYFQRLYGNLINVEEGVDTTGKRYTEYKLKSRAEIEKLNISDAELEFYNEFKKQTEFFAEKIQEAYPGKKMRKGYIPHIREGFMESLANRNLLGGFTNVMSVDGINKMVKLSGIDPYTGEKIYATMSHFENLYGTYKTNDKTESARAIVRLQKIRKRARELSKQGINEKGDIIQFDLAGRETLLGEAQIDRFSHGRSASAQTAPTMDLNAALVQYVAAGIWKYGNEGSDAKHKFEGMDRVSGFVDAAIMTSYKDGNDNAVKWLERVARDRGVLKKNQVSFLGKKGDKAVNAINYITAILALGLKVGIGIGNVVAGKYQNMRSLGLMGLKGELKLFGIDLDTGTVDRPFRAWKILENSGILPKNYYADIGITKENSFKGWLERIAFMPIQKGEHWIQGATAMTMLTDQELAMFDENGKLIGKGLSPERITEIQKRIRKIHGEGYTSADIEMISLYSMGRSLMMFKKYLVSQGKERFRPEMINEFGEKDIGSYRASARFMRKIIVNQMNSEEIRNELQSMDPNIREKTITGMRGALLMMGILAMAFMFGDGEDEDDLIMTTAAKEAFRWNIGISNTVKQSGQIYPKYTVQNAIKGVLGDGTFGGFSESEYKSMK